MYCAPGHTGGIAAADGTPTPIYSTLKSLNPEFVAIATELQPLRSLGVYHTALKEAGCEPLPANTAFHTEGPAAAGDSRGLLFGDFGETDRPTHVVVVNLDYKSEVRSTLVGPANLELFDAATGKWSSTKSMKADLHLPPGGGILVRIAK